MAVTRSRTKGIAPELFQDLLLYVILSGFIVAHLYSVLAYFPRETMENPLLLLKIWENISSFGGFAGGTDVLPDLQEKERENISSFGGFAGGLLGLWLFFRFKARD